MINQKTAMHDKYQLEIKYGYKFNKKISYSYYDIETYLFFPSTLGINKHTYQFSDFYSDIHSYIRLMRPSVKLTNLLSGTAKFFDRLKKLILDMSNININTNIKKDCFLKYEYQIKIICSIANHAIDDYVKSIILISEISELEIMLNVYMLEVSAFCEKFRQLYQELKLLKKEDLLVKFRLVDEYLSILIERFTYDILDHLKSFEGHEKYQFRSKLLNYAISEASYRIKMKYPSVASLNKSNEEVVFRMGILKKFVDSALFLRTNIKKEGQLLEHVLFGCVAGFSMLFASLITLASHLTFGNVTGSFFIAIIVSYIFKDRIKEILRIYVSSKMQKKLFDHKTSIFIENKQIGWCKESFNFIKEKHIEDRILQIRNKDYLIDVDNDFLGENIILYRKQIRIFSKKIWQQFKNYQIYGLNDIFRFNIFKFTQKMDNPEKTLYVADSNNYQKILGERVYHINMIIKYCVKQKTMYDRFRVVLTKDGIKRVELISRKKE